MINKTQFRAGLLLLLLAVLAISAAALTAPAAPAEDTCLGVPILTREEMAAFETYHYRDYSENLKYMGEYVALDREHSRIYLSQPIGRTDTAQTLPGRLTVDVPGTKLYFAPDELWEDLDQAVSSGHGFRLLVRDLQNACMEYEVVFTTLPVISMNGKHLYEDAELRSVSAGRLTLWDPAETALPDGGVQANRAHWHIRGGASRYKAKSAWKISLKSWDGDNKSEEFLGLGSDDDWILNPMSMEDTNIREKLFMDLWNEMAAETAYNYPMSTGRYVELVLDGEYCGLYILQRRVDDRYLDLKEDSVLVKGMESEQTGEISYDFFSPMNRQIPADTLKAVFEELDCRALNPQNFVDVNLFLQLFVAVDNNDHVKNMYYAFDRTETGYEITMIPWDTDMTMGILWSMDVMGFDYDYDATIAADSYRREWDAMAALHPDLYQNLCDRWFELREGIFDESWIREKTEGYLALLSASGADVRDQEKWGLFYEGRDSMPRFCQFLTERLAILDRTYGS